MACGNNGRLGDGLELPSRERVYVSDYWRVAHSFNSALAGWLVVLPRRHLTADEAAPLGTLLHDLSTALAAVTGCTKSYLIFFAEAEGYAHLHIHVVPRMPDFDHDVIGPRVFAFLQHPEAEWVTTDEQDRIADEIRDRLPTT